MKLYTIENIEYEKSYGMVSGNVVKGKFFIKDFFANIRKLMGKELIEYTELIEESRKLAVERMCKQAEMIGANAVIGIQYTTTDIASEAAEICVYGTAVRVKE